MVSVLNSGLKDLSLSPGRVIVLCSWVRHFTLKVPQCPGVQMGIGKPDEMLGWGN